MKTLWAAVIVAALAVTGPAHAGTNDLSGKETNKIITPLATGASMVTLVFELPNWPKYQTFIIRHFCPPGVEMHSQGFALFDTPAHPSLTIRNFIRLTNARNIPGANGEQGFSWYLRNEGETAGAVKLEISFVARRVVQP
jgi:hypothetical protein